MTSERTDIFIAWLNTHLADADLTDSKLAGRVNMSHSVLSKARKGILPKFEACVKIARGFHVSPIEVFQVAGLIPTPQNLDSDFERLKYLYESFPNKKRRLLVQYAKMLDEQDL